MNIKVKSSILNRKETVITAAICILVIAMTILILKAMGRPLISNSGTVKLWHSEVVSSENSQHLSDWYSFSHIVHGFLFFFILWLVSKKIPLVRKFSIALVIAVVMESIWEIVENTDFIINRYREATIAFMMAARLSVIASLSIVVAFEVMLAFVIRDNLALNIIMLIYPIDAIKEWQLG